ncbi:hypothetical protein DMO24_22825 [Modestobacter versicolor]|uniref:Uncharacterized protein n=1 Tax=Modestobacter versicolor TaxID=429133 RepID=A0A323V2Q6_9ACTN|nr:hypothetical protein DMO24_22825 [Modestobacter versicolor]
MGGTRGVAGTRGGAGRPQGAGAAGPAGQRAREESTTRRVEEAPVEMVGDAELFDVTTGNAPVLDRPAERTPAARPGPALGRDGA